jgi:hypothetical protein
MLGDCFLTAKTAKTAKERKVFFTTDLPAGRQGSERKGIGLVAFVGTSI